MNYASMIAKTLGALGFSVCMLAACGDDSTGPLGGSGGSPPEGGSGGEAPLECGANETAAPWRCTCVLGAYPLSDCAADACDGQAGCDVACEDTGGTTEFVVAEYIPGPDCDTICGIVCGCDGITECDVYQYCGVLPGQTPEMAADALACQAANADKWTCTPQGPEYAGPSQCD